MNAIIELKLTYIYANLTIEKLKMNCSFLRSFILLISVFLSLTSSAQEDFSWWIQKHNWDGVTPWNQYMTISSAFLGPNALPVPEFKNGLVDSVSSVQISFDQILSKGDPTQDFFLKGVLPLFKNRMSIELFAVPLEWYKMDTVTRDLRAVRTRSGKGSAGGDIYLSTQIQIVKNRKHFPDLLLRFAIRTASGTHLRDARYTDAPGYYVDLSFGKSVLAGNKFIKDVRLFADAGFYIYQTYDLQYLQNDCFLFGGGFSMRTKKLSWANSIGGYSGYLNNGDKPLVYRSELRLLNSISDWAISYENGLHDYSYQKFRVSYIFHIPTKKFLPSVDK